MRGATAVSAFPGPLSVIVDHKCFYKPDGSELLFLVDIVMRLRLF